MTAWEQMEDYLFRLDLAGRKSFVNAEVATALDLTPKEASYLTREYQRAQLSPRCDTLFVIKRTGRTRNARWHVGHKVADLTMTRRQFSDDTELRVHEHLLPLIDLIADKNPQARRAAAKVTMQIGRLLQQLEDLAA